MRKNNPTFSIRVFKEIKNRNTKQLILLRTEYYAFQRSVLIQAHKDIT